MALSVHAMPVAPHIVYYRVDEAQQLVRILRVYDGRRMRPRQFKWPIPRSAALLFENTS